MIGLTCNRRASFTFKVSSAKNSVYMPFIHAMHLKTSTKALAQKHKCFCSVVSHLEYTLQCVKR